MIDITIPYKSIVMRCDQVNGDAFLELSHEVELEFYKPGMENAWVQIEKSAGEFQFKNHDQAKEYFLKEFGDYMEELGKRCIFLKDKKTREYVGTCMAWFEKKEGQFIPVLHWLAVSDEYAGKGYARMLITQVMHLFEKYTPGQSVYLHTQPSSYRAIKLYNDFGFCIARSDFYETAKNEYEEARPILEEYMSGASYKKLIETSVE